MPGTSTARVVAGLMAVLLWVPIAGTAATDPEVYRLKSDVAQLRNQVRYLEAQVRQLEAQVRQVRAQPSVPAASVPMSPWYQLQAGMSKSQVAILLGEPSEQDVGAGVDVWHYTQRGDVEFDAEGRVSRWKMP